MGGRPATILLLVGRRPAAIRLLLVGGRAAAVLLQLRGRAPKLLVGRATRPAELLLGRAARWAAVLLLVLLLRRAAKVFKSLKGAWELRRGIGRARREGAPARLLLLLPGTAGEARRLLL